MRHTYFSVLGQPFFSVGGQVHNSSGYPIGRKGNRQYEEDCERSFQSLKAIGANTIAVPVCWDAFEPEEGAYDVSYVHTVIDNIRCHGLHGILLWFGTWKNGQMEYTPAWVKKDRKRFPRVLCKDGRKPPFFHPTAAAIWNRMQRLFVRLWKSSGTMMKSRRPSSPYR